MLLRSGKAKEMNDGVVKVLNKITDLLVLNILFLVSCIPVVTVGAALSSMYAVSLRSVRYEDGYVFQTYWKAFKRNFKQSTIVWLVYLVLGVLLWIDVRFFSQVDLGILSRVFFAVTIAIIFLLWMLSIWLFPVIAKMDDRLIVQVTNAAKMAVGYFFPYTAACMLIQGAAVYLAVINIGMMMLMLVLGFAGVSYMCSFFIYKVFASHIKEDPASEYDMLYPPQKDAQEKHREEEEKR